MVAEALAGPPPQRPPPSPAPRRRILFSQASFCRLPLAELLVRLSLAVITTRHVAGDRLGLALGRIAEAAAARRRYAHHVADADLDVLVLGQMRRPVRLAALAHGHGIDASRRAAQD